MGAIECLKASFATLQGGRGFGGLVSSTFKILGLFLMFMLASLLLIPVMWLVSFVKEIPFVGPGLAIILNLVVGFAVSIGLVCTLFDYFLSSAASGELISPVQAFKALPANLKNYVASAFYGVRANILPVAILIGVNILYAILTAVLASNGAVAFMLILLVVYLIACVAVAIMAIPRSAVGLVKIIEPSYGYDDCLQIGKAMIKGHLWSLIGTGLLGAVVCSVLAMTFIGYPIGAGLVYLMSCTWMLARYEEASGNSVGGNSVDDEHYEETPKRARQARQDRRAPQIEDTTDEFGNDTDEFGEPFGEPFGGAETKVDTLEQDMIRAIRGAFVTKISHNGVSEIALPIDIVTKGGVEKYNFLVKKPEGVKPVQVNKSDIDSLLVLEKRFNPAQYVNWKPNWKIERDWDI